MSYIPNNTPKIGDWVVTKKAHSSMSGKFTKGTRVQIVDIDSIRGYAIRDEYGNFMCEIGWEI